MKLFNKGKDESNGKYKINYAPIYLGFVSIFIALSVLTLTTYAWFSDTALIKGNSISAGNLHIELLADDDYLNEIKYSGDKSDFKTYSRDFNGKTEEYYITTNSDVPVIKLDNLEPGQIYPVKFYVLNTGDLAVKYSCAFSIQVDSDGNELSFTGIETLEREKESGVISDTEYEKILRELNKKQRDEDGNDIGGHLEDILDVYIGTSQLDIKEENYVGKLSQIMNGKLGSFMGYALPLDEVIDEEKKIIQRKVDILDNEGNILRTEEDVTEMGYLSYMIMMPWNAGSEYEYASLSFSLGATATQAEYEKDGLNSMIYDADTTTLN